MRVRAILMATALAAMTSAAPVPKELAKQDEKDKQLIVGEWRDEREGVRMLFGTGGVTMWGGVFGQKGQQDWYTLGPAARPKTIDLIHFVCVDKEPKRGIYKFDGDTLTICVNLELGGARPTDFEARGKVNATRMTLTRVKEGDRAK